MTAFTVLHTAISLLPVGFGFAAFAARGRIDPKTRLGKWYLGTMLAGTVSSFGFIPTLGFTFGQVLTLVTLGLLLAGMFTLRGAWRKRGTIQTLALSASYLMLMVFATTEVLKHFPRSHPFAASADDPSLLPVRLTLLVMFVFGVGYQLLTSPRNRALARLESVMAPFRQRA